MSKRKRKPNPDQVCFAFMRPPLPVTYGDCLANVDRTQCEHWTCRHNLIGELTRMSTRDAVRAMCAFKQRFVDSICALDYAEDKPSDRTIATMLGTGMGTMRRETRQAKHRLAMQFWPFKPWHHPACWLSE